MFKRNGSGWGWKGLVCRVYGEMESHVTDSSAFKLLTKSRLWSKSCFVLDIENENKFNIEIILFDNSIETHRNLIPYSRRDALVPWRTPTCYLYIYVTDWHWILQVGINVKSMIIITGCLIPNVLLYIMFNVAHVLKNLCF